MLKLFSPDQYIKDFRFVDLDDLKKRKIRLIICDVDNTLVAHDEGYPTKEVKAFIKKIKEKGFAFCLISNNFNDRVSTFANELDVKTYPMAKKPLKGTYRKIIKDWNIQAKEIACIGDQLLTDIFGGKRMHMYTILTNPLYEKDLKATKINRKIENYIFKLLAKKGSLVKGEYHE